MIKECNIQNRRIVLKKIEGKYYFFAYLKCTGDDLKAEMAKMAAELETQRWWKETDACQFPLPEGAAQGKIWARTEQVFYSA